MPAPRFATFLPVACLGILLLSGCASLPAGADADEIAEFRATNDPMEPLNRAMYQVDLAADTLVVRPAAEAYGIFVPEPVRDRVRNVLDNLRLPVVFANDVFQTEPRRAGDTLMRFAINSTFGIAGIFDVATDWGYPGHNEDFGQTLATWGVGEMAYMYVPVLGPTNPRDLAGLGVDTFLLDPWGYVAPHSDTADALRIARPVVGALDIRQGLIPVLDDVRRTSLDPYATIRSAYRQRRNANIANELDGMTRDPEGRRLGGQN